MKAKVWHLIILLLLLTPCWLNAKEISDAQPNRFKLTDSLLHQYLTDTLHAGSNVKSLDSIAFQLKSWPDTRTQAIDVFQAALMLEPYIKDSAEILNHLYADFASFLQDAGATDLSLQYLTQAIKYCRQTNWQHATRLYGLTGKLGSFYLQAQRYDSARYYYNMALSEAQRLNDTIYLAAANNNMGLLFFAEHDNKGALQYFKMASALLGAGIKTDFILLGSIHDNLAETALAENRLADACNLYAQNLALYKKLGILNDILKTQLGIARVFAVKKDWPKLAALLNEFSPVMKSNLATLPFKYVSLYYELWIQYDNNTGKLQQALAMETKLAAYKDRVYKEKDENISNLTGAIISSNAYKFGKESELYQLKEQQLNSDRSIARKNLLISVIIIALSIVTIFLLVSFYRNRNRMQKNKIVLQQQELDIQTDRVKLHQMELEMAAVKLNMQQLEQEKIEQELDYKKKDISDLAVYLSNLKDRNDTLLEKLNHIKAKKPAEQKEAVTNLVNELGAVTNTREKISMIQENIDQVNKQFTEKLRSLYPDLTKSEIELCGLFKMNMSNKEISVLKNISPESIKMARYRLRKKLQLAPEADIYLFFSDL